MQDVCDRVAKESNHWNRVVAHLVVSPSSMEEQYLLWGSYWNTLSADKNCWFTPCLTNFTFFPSNLEASPPLQNHDVCDPIKILAELMWSMERNYKEFINHSQQSNYLIYCIKDILSLVFYNQSEQKGKKRKMPLIKQAYQMPTRQWPKRIMKCDHWYITHISKIQTCTTHRTKAVPNICWGKK